MQDILVVEDDPLAGEATMALLEVLGLFGHLTPTVREARSVIEEFAPDAVLLDLHLPGEDGFSLLDDLDRLGLGDVPVQAMTGFYLDEPARRRLAGRGVGMLIKPFGLVELASALGVQTDRRSSEAAARVSGPLPVVATKRCDQEALIMAEGRCVQAHMTEAASTTLRLVGGRLPFAIGDQVRVRTTVPGPGLRPLRLAIDGRVIWSLRLVPGIEEVGITPTECSPRDAIQLIPAVD